MVKSLKVPTLDFRINSEITVSYYGIVKDEQWNYHLGKMYGCVCVDVCVCVCDK